MKVLQINSVCGVGSTGRIATDLHSILKDQGHESYIAYGRGEAKNCENAIKIGSKLDNYLHVAQTRLFDRHGWGSYWATKKFIKQIQELNPDVIHLHNIHGYYINIKVLFDYLKKTNKPVVWTLHDCWAFTGHCSYFDYIECNKWQEECMKCKHKNEYPTSKFLSCARKNFKDKKFIFNQIDNLTLVTPSNWLKEITQKSFLSKNKIRVIPNGIDLNVFKNKKGNFKARYNIEDKKIILGVANIWDRRKGLESFKALSNVLKDSYKIVLVGVSEEQKRNLPTNILGITRTESIEELVEIYSESDVFVNLSVEETMGLVTVEALACGIPAVVYKATAIPEVIDPKCGIAVEKGKIDKVEKAIKRIIEEKSFNYSDCIDRAKIYDKNERFNEYIELYKRVSKKR